MNEQHRFRPPSTEVRDTDATSQDQALLIARGLAVGCIVLALAQLAFLANSAIGAGLGLGVTYAFAPGPMLLGLAGYMLWARRRFAVVVVLVAVLYPSLASPAAMRLLTDAPSPVGYWTEVVLRLKGTPLHIAALYVVLVAFSAWDHQRRFGRATDEP